MSGWAAISIIIVVVIILSKVHDMEYLMPMCKWGSPIRSPFFLLRQKLSICSDIITLYLSDLIYDKFASNVQLSAHFGRVHMLEMKST